MSDLEVLTMGDRPIDMTMGEGKTTIQLRDPEVTQHNGLEAGSATSWLAQPTVCCIAFLRAVLVAWFYPVIAVEADISLLPVLFGLVGGMRISGVMFIGVRNVLELVLVLISFAAYVILLIWRSRSSGNTSTAELLMVCALGSISDNQPWVQKRMVHLAGDDSTKLTTLSQVINIASQIGLVTGTVGASTIYLAFGYEAVLFMMCLSSSALVVVLLFDRAVLKTVGPEPTATNPVARVWIDYINMWILYLNFLLYASFWSNMVNYLNMKIGSGLAAGSYILSGSTILCALTLAVSQILPIPNFVLFRRPHNQVTLLFVQSSLLFIPVLTPGSSEAFYYTWAVTVMTISTAAGMISIEMLVGVGTGCTKFLRDANALYAAAWATAGVVGPILLEISAELLHCVFGIVMMISGIFVMLAYNQRNKEYQERHLKYPSEVLLNVMLNVMYPPQVAELTATHSTRLHVPDQEISAMSRMAQVVPAPQKLKPTESDIRVIRD